LLVYGPVPSRRLGRSLGVNNIPPKLCSYSCAYCQVGRTSRLQLQRRPFYEPEAILEETRSRLLALRERGDRADYVSFVPDGEPTLDAGLGRSIRLLKDLGVPVAVISNASLIDQEPVRRELQQADWVSLKLDAAGGRAWRKINRPQRSLSLPSILEGMLTFAREYRESRGRLVTETMLVSGVNDTPEELQQTAAALRRLEPAVAYLAVPVRPPAESWVEVPEEDNVLRAYQIFAGLGLRVELLTGSEGDAFSASGRAEEDLLAITAVHPMRRSAVEALLQRDGAGWGLVQELLERGRLAERSYRGEAFYLRRFGSREPT
jgi:wyosine [tRNA(Phe)-imidazoG37] synthetase (radical SAM superfamily)